MRSNSSVGCAVSQPSTRLGQLALTADLRGKALGSNVVLGGEIADLNHQFPKVLIRGRRVLVAGHLGNVLLAFLLSIVAGSSLLLILMGISVATVVALRPRFGRGSAGTSSTSRW